MMGQAFDGVIPGLALLASPFILLALGSALLSARLNPARLLIVLVFAVGTAGSLFALMFFADSWSTFWLSVFVWLAVLITGCIVLAIGAERTSWSIAPVILGGAATGLVLFGAWVFSHGWIAVILGMGIILIGLLPAGLAYSVIHPAGIAGIVRNAGVLAIAGMFGLSGFGMLNSQDTIVQGIGLVLCLATVGLLMLSFRGALPQGPGQSNPG